MKKKFGYIRFFIYIVLGIIFMVSFRAFLPSIHYIVGAVMLLYAIEEIVECIHTHKSVEDVRFFDSIILIILALIMVFIGSENFSTGCIIWAVWSICRESLELEEIYKFRKIRFTLIVSAVESVAVIVLSVMMIANPTEHHAMVHTFFLGIELILHGVIPNVNEHFFLKNARKDDDIESK